jgi:hypothetical protein
MADQATQELLPTTTEQPEPNPAVRAVTSVANPRRIRLSRIPQDVAPTS